MTQEDAFLQDILENHDEDTPRRVYADWLLDRDDPVSAARGEFIHAQCDLARWPGATPRPAVGGIRLRRAEHHRQSCVFWPGAPVFCHGNRRRRR